jgi:hypothetical protein
VTKCGMKNGPSVLEGPFLLCRVLRKLILIAINRAA